MKQVVVSAGIIIRDDKFFVALRNQDQHQGGCWEFPGGKCEAGEAPVTALKRELAEECGIQVEQAEMFQRIDHDYGDKAVQLHFFIVNKFAGEPHGKEGQVVAWVTLPELSELAFPAANQPIVDALVQQAVI